MAWKIDQKLVGELQAAANNVRDAIQDVECEYEDKTERWQDSDRGQEVREWIENLASTVDEILETADTLWDDCKFTS